MYGKDLLNKLQNNKTKDGNKIILEQTQGTFIGSAIGLGVGLVIGYSRNYNLLMSAFVGALIGGVISKFTIPKK